MRKAEIDTNNLPPVNARLYELITETTGSVNGFSKSLTKISQARLNSCFNISSKTGKYPTIQSDVFSAISEAYPSVSIDWIISGNGTMHKVSDNIIENKSNLSEQNEKEQRLLSHKDIEQLLTKQKDEIMSELTDVVKDLTNVMLGQTGVMKDQIKLNDSSIVASFEFMKEQLATLQKAIDKVDNKADKVQDSVFKIERKIG